MLKPSRQNPSHKGQARPKTNGRTTPRPLLKWVGGKGQLVPHLLEHSPDNFGRYHEPFMGGAALFFALKREGKLGRKKSFLSDANAELVVTFNAVRESPHDVIEVLGCHRYEKDYYYKVRKLDPSKMAPAELAARMIFLNKTGFNGLYRVNRSGGFNVPFGRYSNPQICDKDNILAVSSAFRNARIVHSPFEKVAESAVSGDFVYFDPPYVPVSDTANFVSYAKDGFGVDDQKRLVQVFRDLANRGVFVMLSNSDTAWVREQYREFRQIEVKANRMVNSNRDRRGPVGELIVLSYDSGMTNGR